MGKSTHLKLKVSDYQETPVVYDGDSLMHSVGNGIIKPESFLQISERLISSPVRLIILFLTDNSGRIRFVMHGRICGLYWVGT